MKKTYVLDTNVLLSDPNCLNAFQENDLIIPMIVLEELDNHKSRPDDVGRNARHVSRALDDMRSSGSSLIKGVKLPGGGMLTVASLEGVVVPDGLKKDKADNLIIAYMKGLPDAILVSKDINVRIKCDSMGIKCEDYRNMRVASDPHKFYRGVEVVDVPNDVVDEFFEKGRVQLPAAVLKNRKLYSNQIVVVKHQVGDQSKSAIARCLGPEGMIVPVKKIESVFGLSPRNKEQTFSLDLLLNPEIKLLTLVGPSGTGKTLLALAAALEQLKGLGSIENYERLIVTRPVQPVGRDIGFLPGTLEEKMEPWIAPVRDNLNFLMGHQSKGRRRNKTNDEPYLALLQQKGLIEIEAITFIRGRSIPNSFIVIDEAQNLSMHELKTIITRVGDGTKIVLTGDIEQIDNTHVDVFTNGLTYAVERFKDHKIAAHVTLQKGERSELATLASKIL